MNCLQALGSVYAPAGEHGGEFQENCAGFGFALNDFSVTAIPTGIVGTGDPFSIFYLPTSIRDSTAASDQFDPLQPTATSSSGMTGGAVRLSAFQSLLNAVAVGAVAAAAIFMGGLPL